MFWARREDNVPLETEEAVDVIEEPQTGVNLFLDLIPSAENVRIVLLKTAYSSEPREGSTDLITVQDPKVRKPDRQLLV